MNHEYAEYPDTANERPKRAAIEYVFCEHSLKNLSKIVDALIASDGDIIAIEKVREGSFGMGTAEEKADLSRRMTEFLSSDSDITETAAQYFGTDDPLFTKLLDALRGSDKRIVLIDMGTDDEGYFLREASQECREAYNRKFNAPVAHDDTWKAELWELADEYQIASARECEYREFVMGEQIESLARDNPESKITVMMGASHTPVSYGKNRQFDVSRTFVPTDEAAAAYAPIEKMRFGSSTYTRALRLNLNRLGLSVFDEDNKLITPAVARELVR